MLQEEVLYENLRVQKARARISFTVLCVWAFAVCCCLDFLKSGSGGSFGCLLMRIRRRKSKKRYLRKKGVYDYEQLYVDIPAKFREVVEPFLGQARAHAQHKVYLTRL